MADKELRYSIKAVDNASKPIGQVQSRMGSLVSSLKANYLKIVGITAAIGTAFYTIKKAVDVVWGAIKTSFQFESFQVSFEVLLGSIDKAVERMEYLKRISSVTPFQFAELAETSRTLDLFSNNLLGTGKMLLMVGDSAAIAQKDIREVGMSVGRMYMAIKDGRPLGEAAQSLMQMGVLTGEVRNQLEDMTAAGASNIDIWNTFTKSLDRFNGGMDKMSETGDGKISTLKDVWTLAVAQFGDAFADAAKGGILELTNALRTLIDDGSINEWADRAMTALDELGKAFKVWNKIRTSKVGQALSGMDPTKSWRDAGESGRKAILGAVLGKEDTPEQKADKQKRSQAEKFEREILDGIRAEDEEKWKQQQLEKEMKKAEAKSKNVIMAKTIDTELDAILEDELDTRTTQHNYFKRQMEAELGEMEENEKKRLEQTEKEKQIRKDIAKVEKEILDEQKRQAIQSRIEAIDKDIDMVTNPKMHMAQWRGFRQTQQTARRDEKEFGKEDERMNRIAGQNRRTKSVQQELDDWLNLKNVKAKEQARNEEEKKLRGLADNAIIESEKHLRELNTNLEKNLILS